MDRSGLHMSPPFQQRSDSADVATLGSHVRIQRPCAGPGTLFRFCAHSRAPSLQQDCVFAAPFQVFWSLVPAVVRSADACFTLLRPTIVLGSHLRSCKDLAGEEVGAREACTRAEWTQMSTLFSRGSGYTPPLQHSSQPV